MRSSGSGFGDTREILRTNGVTNWPFRPLKAIRKPSTRVLSLPKAEPRLSLTYNANDLLSSASLSKESVTTTTQFAYDGNGNLTAVTDPLGRVTHFSYDALKRLTNVTFDSPTPETPTATGTRSRAITLDKLDNILKITDNENAMVTEIIGELEGKGKALNQYSKFNDLPLEYDTNGNLSAKGSRLFAYDYQNRLIRSSKGDDAVTFTYDIFGRQTSRTDLSGTYHFFYAGDQKIEERNASGQVTKHYVWGNGIDELLRLDIYNGTSSTPYYIHTDAIGSTTAITDGSGNLVERVTYNVYGAPTFTNALGQTLKKSTIRNTALFQGREYDYDLALYNYRARYFDPTMGRFLQTDPLGYQDSMNLYQGMNMNPLNFTDPMGEYFVVPNNDPNESRILRALAAGTLSEKGSALFWTLFSDPRPITIHSGDLKTDLHPRDLVQKSKKLDFQQTYGAIDPDITLMEWTEKKTVKQIEVSISFKNIDNYFKVKNRFGYIFNNQGKIDKYGVTTIYHELTHVEDFFNLDSSLTRTMAGLKAAEGDYMVDLNGNIINPKKYSSYSRSQLFGESVFDEFNKVVANNDDVESKINKIIDLLRERMILGISNNH